MGPDPHRVLQRLRSAYGPLRAPKRRDPVDEVVLTILSQNTSDTNRDRAWTSLRERFSTWDEVADAKEADLVEAIRVGGLAQTKAPRIQAVLRQIRDEHGSIDLSLLAGLSDEDASDYLCRLPGIGPKTAACVLAFALRRPVIPVDTHVHRTARRLGFIGPKTGADAAHRALGEVVAARDRLPLHVALITHGRRTCLARRPRCSACVVEDLCPRVGVEE